MAKSAKEKRATMSRKDGIIDMLKMFYGLPPHDDGGNICRSDGYFAMSIVKEYGKPLEELEREVGWAQIKGDWEAARRAFMGNRF